MEIKKRKTNNPKGRPAGKPNKVTANIKEGIDAFLQANWSDVQKEFNKLDPKDKLDFVLKLMRYSVPTLQAVAFKGEIDTSNKLNQLNNAQLNSVIDQILLETAPTTDDD